jgi:hypothetical protein
MKGEIFGPIDIFRSGDWSPMGGGALSFSDAQLQQIATAYDSEKSPSPIVIGHPKIDAPAYGWIERVFVEGGKLKATIRDTVAAFAEQVRAGRYKKVSVSLYKPDASNNPKPGSWYLKHVGFLGAAAPAVAGLDPVSFADTAAGETVEFTMDGIVEMSAMERELAELRRERSANRLDKLIDAGKVLPAHKAEVLDFVDSLDGQETLSFADGEATTRRDWFLSFLDKQPAVVSFGQIDMSDDPAIGPVSRLSVPAGFDVDASRTELYERARKIERDRQVSFAEAVDIAAGLS